MRRRNLNIFSTFSRNLVSTIAYRPMIKCSLDLYSTCSGILIQLQENQENHQERKPFPKILKPLQTVNSQRTPDPLIRSAVAVKYYEDITGIILRGHYGNNLLWIKKETCTTLNCYLSSLLTHLSIFLPIHPLCSSLLPIPWQVAPFLFQRRPREGTFFVQSCCYVLGLGYTGTLC